LYSAEDPEQLRGPQHDGAWADEIAKWRYKAAWDNLMMGLRLGSHPKAVATTTPRPTPLVRELVRDPHVVVTGGSTYDNFENLPETFVHEIIHRYEGTRLGKQELYAQLLEDNPDALWQPSMFKYTGMPHDLGRVIIAVDPSGSEDGAETGIVVAGISRDKTRGYVLEDLSQAGSPDTWARVVNDAFARWEADRVVAEANYGGDMVEATLRTVNRNISYRAVFASRGKAVRAEPVAALYEQGRILHVGTFPDLEDQMCTWSPNLPGQKSPDRMDAVVWAFTELMLKGSQPFSFAAAGERPNPDLVQVGAYNPQLVATPLRAQGFGLGVGVSQDPFNVSKQKPISRPIGNRNS
jgi:phage terminase large subunit-like protein